MAVEYTAVQLQTVPPNQNVIFTDTVIPCSKGYVSHRNDSGLFKLRGITNQCKARYRVSFGANIAIPDEQDTGPISIAIAISGEPVRSTIMTVTPTDTNAFFNVSADVFIEVERNCCAIISIENVSDPAIPISVRNANLIIDRTA